MARRSLLALATALFASGAAAAPPHAASTAHAPSVSTGKPAAPSPSPAVPPATPKTATALPSLAAPKPAQTAPPPGAKVAAKPPSKPAPSKPVATKGKVAASFASNWAPPGYVAMVKKWHEASGAPKIDAAGRPKLVLHSINRGDRVELVATTDRGGFSPMELEKASFMLRSADGMQHPVDARLLDIAYQLQRHFGAAEVRFLSGYRTPKKLGSNHGYGRALDLVVPGATDEEVASYARSLGYVGVGIYPTSGFVHLDVRDRSFFWVDKSGPGKPNKTVGILAGEAAAADKAAHAAGRSGTPTAKIGRDVDAALATLAKVNGAPQPPPNDAAEEPTDDHDHP